MSKKYIWVLVSFAVVILVGVIAYSLASKLEISPQTPNPNSLHASGPTVFENKYLKITLSPGWALTVDNPTQHSVNITKGEYILQVNPLFGHASGVGGGRFNEVAAEMRSAQAVLSKVEPPVDGAYCGEIEKQGITDSLILSNYYTDSAQWAKYFAGTAEYANQCTFPADGKPAWFGALTAGSAQKVFGRTAPGDVFNEFAITVAYDTTDINKLPKKDDPALKQALSDVSAMLKTLELKPIHP